MQSLSEGSGERVHTVLLSFSDGAERVVQVADRESVLSASMRQGVPLLHQCMGGSCGTCVARVSEGALQMRSSSGHCLLPSEVRAGHRLLCLSTALADARVTLDYPSNLLDRAAATRMQARIEACQWIAENVVQLVLALPDASFEFTPGQYVRVRVPGTDEWRSYSMASIPSRLPKVELLVRVLPEGTMSAYLRGRCAPGDVLDIEGPFGIFLLREARAAHIMIAGGTGLAPILSMLDQSRRVAGKRPRVILSFGCASPEALFCLDDLEARAAWMPNLESRISVDRAPADYQGRIGNPVDAITAADITDPDTVAYLCGPSRMIAAARARLASFGVRPENIYAELFVPSAQTASPSQIASADGRPLEV